MREEAEKHWQYIEEKVAKVTTAIRDYLGEIGIDFWLTSWKQGKAKPLKHCLQSVICEGIASLIIPLIEAEIKEQNKPFLELEDDAKGIHYRLYSDEFKTELLDSGILKLPAYEKAIIQAFEARLVERMKELPNPSAWKDAVDYSWEQARQAFIWLVEGME